MKLWNNMRILFLSAVVLIIITGCADFGKKYETISQEEAAEIMSSGSEYLVVDVRSLKEYDEAHIPGAVCVPIEDIREEKTDSLPDKDRGLLLYCRTGRRAEDAARILADAGYTNEKVFLGILTSTRLLADRMCVPDGARCE